MAYRSTADSYRSIITDIITDIVIDVIIETTIVEITITIIIVIIIEISQPLKAAKEQGGHSPPTRRVALVLVVIRMRASEQHPGLSCSVPRGVGSCLKSVWDDRSREVGLQRFAQ